MESLNTELKIIKEQCLDCIKCQSECEFLKRYGKPKDIADSFYSDKFDREIAFECNMCELCSAVCPAGLNPVKMLQEMRRVAQKTESPVLKKHGGILAYERRGTSKRYTWYGLPDKCDTIFFPGCTLPGTRPSVTFRLFKLLQKQIPALGVVLDCCTKPSHDLGRMSYFDSVFREMKYFLLDSGIRHVLVACPNCFKVFQKYGDGLSVRTVYEFLSKTEFIRRPLTDQVVTVHDSCVMRFEKETQESVRDLISGQGLRIREMAHSRENTLCCGEGGSAGFISPDIAEKWCLLRKQEAEDNRVVTYCAGCTNSLDRYMPATHILDLFFEPESALKGDMKGARPPVTYLNRLKLKRRFKRDINAAVIRERSLEPQPGGRDGILKKILVFLIILLGIFAIHFFIKNTKVTG